MSETSAAETAEPAGQAEPRAIDAGRLRVAIVRIARLLRHDIAGLTPTQASTLVTIERCGPLRLGDLAAHEGVTPSTLTRPVAALEEGGYLERRTDPADARSSVVAVSSDGRKLLATIRGETTALLAKRLEWLSEEQRAALAIALPALERLADMDPREATTRR
ncbi:MAG: MarR family transcriptional regulator [Streptosporangiales bacterium]|nr:MarR family transcriptional regulator [Streptosporangiales bacterium]